MRRIAQPVVVLAAAMLMLAAVALPASAAPSQRTTGPVHLLNPDFSVGDEVSGSLATLTTTSSGASFTLRTSGLEAGAYTIWWIIFNNPDACTHSAGSGLLCGAGDLGPFGGDPAVDSSALYAAGHIVSGDGPVSFSGHRSAGDESGIILFGSGLTAPLDAEIHLIVHSHGPVIKGMENEMIHSFDAGCREGEPNVCTDVQAAAFAQ